MFKEMFIEKKSEFTPEVNDKFVDESGKLLTVKSVDIKKETVMLDKKEISWQDLYADYIIGF